MKAETTHQKLRGGYYTPKHIADFLANWAVQTPTSKILEPSYGDGVLLQSAVESLIAQGAQKKNIVNLIHGIEIDESEAIKARKRIQALGIAPSKSLIESGDFFAYAKASLLQKRFFDVVIGNPPFIRYQNFLEDQRTVAFELMRQAGLHPNRLTNSWVPFLVASSLLLNDHGRIAMIIPAELLQVNYAAELRYFIGNFYSRVTIFTFRKLVFEGIQQEVVLLLGERNGNERTGIRTIELEHSNDLVAYEHTDFSDKELKPMDHSTEKWTQYFLSSREIGLLRDLRANSNLYTSGDFIDVDVGVVTGLNEYFVLNAQQVAVNELEPYTKRIVSRSGHLQGTIFSERDWKSNVEKQLPSFILSPPDVPFGELPESIKRYVVKGEEEGVHKGYKCRIRKRWYIVPSVWTPPAFMLRQVHAYPKIVLNKAEATCTDTIHRVRLRNGKKSNIVAAAFLNSITFAFAEVIGRSYGGGVLELEPNEAERLPMPMKGAENLDLKRLHTYLTDDNIEAVLNNTDKILLIDGIGLSAREARQIRGIWEKLRDRRIQRKHKK